jgi:hypothetical protein
MESLALRTRFDSKAGRKEEKRIKKGMNKINCISAHPSTIVCSPLFPVCGQMHRMIVAILSFTIHGLARIQ